MSKSPTRDEVSSASRRRFRLLKLAFWLCLLLPLFFWGATNLWLNTSWGRGVVEARLNKRTGMEWRVEGITWSPWRGGTVSGASMLQPEALREYLDQPLIEVSQIQVRPYWGKLFRGDFRLREVRMDSPQITVSVEMLAAIAAETAQKQTLPKQGETTKLVAPQPKKPRPQEPRAPRQGKVPPSQPTEAVEKKAPPPTAPKRLPAGLPLHLFVKGATLRIVSVGKDIDLLNASAIDFDLPLFGEDAKGSLKLGELKVPGVDSIKGIEHKMVWKRPYLEIEEQTLNLDGLKVRYTAQLAALRGYPFFLDLVLDPQTLEHVGLLDRLAIDLKAHQIAGRVRASGSLVQPISWKSSAIVLGDKVSVTERHGGRELHFDEISVPAVFQQGRLQWSSARLIGEDISVLGNGRVSIAGGVSSVTRLVASPELADELKRAMMGVQLISRRPWWGDLDTPDRKYRDVYVTGVLMDPKIDLGNRHSELPLWQTLAATLHFIREEMKEEGVDLQPVPNKKLLEKKNHASHQR